MRPPPDGGGGSPLYKQRVKCYIGGETEGEKETYTFAQIKRSTQTNIVCTDQEFQSFLPTFFQVDSTIHTYTTQIKRSVQAKIACTDP